MRKNKEELSTTREYKRIVSKSFFIIKPLKWLVEYHLNSTESDIMGIILAFQRSKNSNGWFGGGIVALQVYLNKSRDTITSCLSKLVANKYLIKNVDGYYKVPDYAINFEISNISIKSKPKKEITGPNPSGHFALEREYTQEHYDKMTTDIDNIMV